MGSETRAPASRLALLVPASVALAPALGLGAAGLVGLVDGRGLAAALGAVWPAALPAALTAVAALVSRRRLGPLLTRPAQPAAVEIGHERLRRSLVLFGREYWGVLIAAAAITPWAYGVAAGAVGGRGGGMLDLVALSVVVGVLVGLPTFLFVLDRVGTRVAHLGLGPVQVGIKSKLLLLGALTPLLGYALLLHHHGRVSGTWSGGALALGGLLSVLTLTGALLSVRSMRRALRPIDELRARNGATTHRELAKLQPASADEVGLLIQALGRLFRHVVGQSSHMRAVVDNAAEGIIVTSDQGRIETFNPAAERLFGYRRSEVYGQPLSWVLPGLLGGGGAPPRLHGEQEVEGLHRDGYFMPVSVRVSEMQVSGKRMYTCLVADISGRKAAETKLRAAEARYRDLVETAHDLVWSANSEGRWTYLNRACRNIYGYDPEEMVGRALADCRAPEYARQDETAFAQLLASKELVQYETVHLDRHGNRRYLSFNARTHVDPDTGVMAVTGTARDVTAQKTVEHQLTYQAEHDALTGLHNRPYFQDELERIVAHVTRRGIQCAVLFLDVDQFKYINDTLGHAAGDAFLVELGALLAKHARDGDLVARFGGDEFTLLAYNVTRQGALEEAEKFHHLIERYKYAAGTSRYNVTASVGVTLVDEGIRSADDALAHADLACNIAKAQGRNRVHLYNPADRNKAGMADDMGWAARVRDMIENDRFRLAFQPIFSVSDGSILEYEVLMRMVSEDGQVILPSGFMPAAERFGLIHNLDRWMVAKAIRQLAELRTAGDSSIRLSINLSGRSFEDRALLPLIQRLLAETEVDPSALTFEITETAAIANLSAAIQFIGALRRMGCQFALDDFGSGFCSFTYLKHLPVDKLKIDGSFIQGLSGAPMDQAMVQSMNQIAHALGKVTVAEFVEDAQTLSLLRDYGVDFAQGYYLGHPQGRLPRPQRLN